MQAAITTSQAAITTITTSQAATTAIVLAALVAAWAVTHFNEGLPADRIRFSVPQHRYFVALAAHVAAMLGVYLLLVLAIYQGLGWLGRGFPPRDCFLAFSDSCTKYIRGLNPFSPHEVVWPWQEGLFSSALAAALFLRILMPNIPITGYVLDRLRDATRGLALFPLASQTLVAVLSGAAFRARKDSEGELSDELARYGVAANWLSVLSESATRSLLEVLSLRRGLIELSERTHGFVAAFRQITISAKGILFATDPDLAKPDWFVHGHALRRFQQAREREIRQLQTDFRRLLRRTALALSLIEEIDGEKLADETVGSVHRAVSSFVAEECENVIAGHRLLVAEAALSCVPTRAQRTQFLKSLGYEAQLPPALPLWPWLTVFALDLLLFLAPLPIMQLSTSTDHQKFAPAALFAVVHALGQSIALTWAIYPKISSNFARPSVYSLPWPSYIAFGAASYVTGAIILFAFRLTVPLDFPILVPTLISSLSFLVMTVGLSLLIDCRLKSASFDLQAGRMREGATLALLMFASTATVQLVLFDLHLVQVQPPPGSRYIRFAFLALSATLGFIMGYCVPAAAAAFLRKTSILARAPFEKGNAVLFRQSTTASWDTRVSTPA
ncbi:MAG TPA: hypothetical protein VH684_04845 [Xanthobacteraceae bacterium]|jgi:hypothetical protein